MTLRTALLAAAATLTLAATAYAQPIPEYDPGRPNKAVPADSYAEISSASETNWIGVMVYAYDGQEGGRIERLVTGVPGGDPSQLQLRVRGRVVLIPTGSVRLEEDGRLVSRLSVTQMETSTPPGR